MRATALRCNIGIYPPPFLAVYIYNIYTPNLGLEIVIPGREREQNRFRGSIEKVEKKYERVEREHEEVRKSIKKVL